jgi:PAS domain S-box-containing protein
MESWQQQGAKLVSTRIASPVGRVTFAILCVLVAFAVQFSFRDVFERFPFFLFWFALILSAWYGGFVGGLVTTLLAVMLVNFFFIPPVGDLYFEVNDILIAVAFAFIGVVISWLREGQLRTEVLIDQQHEEMRTTLTSIGDAVITTDAAGRVTLMNPVAESLTGWKLDEAAGKPLATVFRIINEDTRQPVESPVDEVLRLRSIVGLNSRILLLAKDGREIPIDDSGAPILDSEGRIRGVVLVFRDISQRREMEGFDQQIQQFALQLSGLTTANEVTRVIGDTIIRMTKASYSSVFRLTDDGQHLERTQSAGLQADYLQQHPSFPLDSLNPITDSVRTNQIIWIQTQADYISRYPQLEADIRQLGVQSAICIPFYQKGRAMGGMFVSFTQPKVFAPGEREALFVMAQFCAQALERVRLYESEQKARLEAEKANETKLQFLGVVSHELRTPLTSIKGFSSTLLADDVTWEPAEQRGFIEIIDQEADKLQDLIEQLLNLSRLQSGTLRVEPAPSTVNEILQAAENQLTMLAENHHLTLSIPDELPMVMVDKERMVQVICNLVQNAAKYSPAGTTITVSAKAVDHTVQIDVRDEGAGISPELREAVFEPFQQLEGGRKGVGLGLAICKAVVESHGGTIWIADVPPPGTQVSFTILTVN